MLNSPLLSCQINIWPWGHTAEVMVPTLAILKAAWAYLGACLQAQTSTLNSSCSVLCLASIQDARFLPQSPFSNLLTVLFDHCTCSPFQGHFSFWTAAAFSVFPILTYLLLGPSAAIKITVLSFHSVLWIPSTTSRFMPEQARIVCPLPLGTAQPPPADAW